jgi:hypothetical protein
VNKISSQEGLNFVQSIIRTYSWCVFLPVMIYPKGHVWIVKLKFLTENCLNLWNHTIM